MIPRWFLWLLDMLAVAVAFVAAYQIVPVLQPALIELGAARLPGFAEALSVPPLDLREPLAPARDLLWLLLVMAASVSVVMEQLGGFGPIAKQSRTRVICTSVIAPLVGVSAVAVLVFATKGSPWSRLFVFTFAGGTLAGLVTHRSVARWYCRRRIAAGFHAKSVLLVGEPKAIAWMEDYFRERVPIHDARPIGYLTLPPADTGGTDGPPTSALERLGTVEDLGGLLVHRTVHEVVAVQPLGGGDWLKGVVEACDYLRVTLRIVPEALLFGTWRDLRLLYHADSLHLPEVVLKPPHLDTDALFAKRVIDVLVSAVLLVLLAPVFLAIAVAIKITTPELPVLYQWRVVGFRGAPFTGYKFTTMGSRADEQKQALEGRNEMNGPVFKIRDDPRVTPLGRFLRKYSLNELPQLWSVLRGDMSLVGPRPAFRHELERYEFWHKRKLTVRPGITCLWQIRGRNQITDFDEWVRMDLEYIEHWSLWLDVRILARTFWVVVAGTGS